MKLEKKVYTDRSEKQKDFAIGVGVFFGLNVLIYILQILVLWAAQYMPASPETLDTISFAISCLVFPLQILANIGVMIYFTLTRTWIAIGMLGTFGFLMGLLLILGIIFSIVCFATGNFGS